MQAYAAIVQEDPSEVLAYTAMIEIAFKHLHDRDRANSIYRQGLEALRDREKQATSTACMLRSGRGRKTRRTTKRQTYRSAWRSPA